jgi:diacylglycerol kinase (ATP)
VTPAPPTLVVVNPASAGGRTARRWPRIVATLRRAEVSVRVELSTERGDVPALVREAIGAGGIRRVVAVGGDGTLNEVVNGCFGEDGLPLAEGLTVGLIPSGTGSDYRRSVGASPDPAAAARVLASGASRPVDVGRVAFADGFQRHFLNAASCGIGAEVVARVDRGRGRGVSRLRRGTFLVAALAELLAYRNRDLVLGIEGSPLRQRCQQVVVASGSAYGGGMLIAPGARVDDGLFDVVVVGDIARLRALAAIPRLYLGRHLSLPEVQSLQATRVRIAPAPGEEAPLLEVDGELAGRLPAEITILPGALRFAALPSHGGGQTG